MQEYWNHDTVQADINEHSRNIVHHTDAIPTSTSTSTHKNDTLESEFDRHRRELIKRRWDKDGNSWKAELCCYLSDLPIDVSKDTDIVKWWGEHAQEYPTLTRIAKDVSGAEIATNRHSRLSSENFEKLQVMKHTWRSNIKDLATCNSTKAEEVQLEGFKELLVCDAEMMEWDNDEADIIAL
ncbi:hypothetical protein PAXINDRAFT_17133 [Paxillus involutus ATCC 200175]|uniref:HAT C-terminal dimerisation domain-containing protein n=1 Tax=Paxillus involutus ATCC 200175 TaxID=664439 RepID=A0A0C9T264_PAXIN|nr:hypothetical protein PAXINDRAFT_17133 [Paxillus involutus ATCC 200175]